MPPRTRHNSSVAAPGGRAVSAAAGPGLLDLPDDVLTHVMSFMRQRERLRGPGLACRQLWQAANASQLNTSASLHLETAEEGGMARLLSICSWLTARGAGSVQRLTLQLPQMNLRADVTFALGMALGACSGTLQRATLWLPDDLLHAAGSWVVPMRLLRVLDLCGMGLDECQFTCSLAPCTQLNRLGLCHIRLASTARLPPSLTGLRLLFDWNVGGPLPQQLSALTRLEALELNHTPYSADSMALLARLPRLRRASFTVAPLPDCLWQLTGLQQLCIRFDCISADTADALQQLTQLTCLALLEMGIEPGVELPPMPQLRALAWDVYSGGVPPLPWEKAPLPSGACLGSLRHLEAGAGNLAASLAMLPRATSLTRLSVAAKLTPAEQADGMQQLASILRSVSALPQLSAVEVQVGQDYRKEPASYTAAPAELHEALAGSPARLLWSQACLVKGGSALERLFADSDDE